MECGCGVVYVQRSPEPADTGPILGDADGDLDVDNDDYLIWKQNFGRSLAANVDTATDEHEHSHTAVMSSTGYEEHDDSTVATAESDCGCGNKAAHTVEKTPISDSVGAANENGVVDAAGYVLWRKHLGTEATVGPVPGDADGDLDVDSADYAVWRREFGMNLQTFSDQHETAAEEASALAVGAALAASPIVAVVETSATDAVVSASQEHSNAVTALALQSAPKMSTELTSNEQVVTSAIAAVGNSVAKTIVGAMVNTDAVFDSYSPSIAADARLESLMLSSRQPSSPSPAKALLSALAVARRSSIGPGFSTLDQIEWTDRSKDYDRVVDEALTHDFQSLVDPLVCTKRPMRGKRLELSRV
jgi:hypothetical protein